jgi:hypothetical protein
MSRSEITIDLGALRRERGGAREAGGASELWAVVKADAYGHGAPTAPARARVGRGPLRGDGERGRGARAEQMRGSSS